MRIIDTKRRVNMKKEVKKKLSIIVPCYKVEKYLPRCLDSLVNQTLEDIEIICINDGSPDNCLKILKDYKKKYGDKIVIIDKENEGVWRGRKDGVKIAGGEYIGFVDSDDYVALDFAEKLYKAAKKEKADISVCGFDRIDLDTGKLYSREMCKKRKTIIVDENPGNMLELNGAPWNKIYKASLLKNMHDMVHVPRVLDDMMFLQLIYINAKKIVFIQDSLVYYMVRKDSIINSVKKDAIEPTYESMKEVRELYAKEKPELLDYMDAIAFLHLGVSLMYRMSDDKTLNFKQAVKDNRKFLNENFPRWKKTKYTKLSYVLTHNGANFKLWVVKMFINFGLFRLFIACYKFMIKRIGIDIKW
jgi:glycosyltransferase involved in cell wall biosynthesis